MKPTPLDLALLEALGYTWVPVRTPAGEEVLYPASPVQRPYMTVIQPTVPAEHLRRAYPTGLPRLASAPAQRPRLIDVLDDLPEEGKKRVTDRFLGHSILKLLTLSQEELAGAILYALTGEEL